MDEPLLKRICACCCLAVCFFVAVGCGSSRNVQTTEQYLSDSASVGFDIEPADAQGLELKYIATYKSGGKTARFRVEFTTSKPVDDKESREFHIQTGRGKFVAEPESDASVLLADLKRALGAKVLPSKVQRTSSIPFTFVSFGENQSQ